ncbi:hypothetical protein F383_38665 [Gossypium arboreum]|uniref:Uncharacterized protein n=1 Tax=Gossypium arboreum TaxID=29729 RepID=A0A0B0MLT6_GOSAR|nr:hypothetical protein F383_38665 [Gossypium arboreum]
MLLIEMLKC